MRFLPTLLLSSSMATLGLGGETTSRSSLSNTAARGDENSHRRLFDSNLIDVVNVLVPEFQEDYCDLSGLDDPVNDSTIFVCDDSGSFQVNGIGDVNGVAQRVEICEQPICAEILYTDGDPTSCDVTYDNAQVCQSCEICDEYGIEVDCSNLEGIPPGGRVLPDGCISLRGFGDSSNGQQGPTRVSVGASIVGMLVAFLMLI